MSNAASSDGEFEAALAAVAGIDGWMSDDQARRLWDRARALVAPATVVEIGSYRGRSAVVLGRAAADGIAVVAIDPHAGNDRGPRQLVGTPEEGQSDHEMFQQNLSRAGVATRVRHVREFSHDAHHAVDGSIELLYIDGAHGYGPAHDDLVTWGDRVAPAGTMLVHDSFSSVGVTLALMTTMFFGGTFRYVGRSQSMAEYHREPVRGLARVSNAARQGAQLPWFARNLVVKLALVLHARPVARLLGHRTDTYPY